MEPSAYVYSGLSLRLYDFVVLIFSNYWVWRCPTERILLPFFQKHIGQNAHLDIGVGTGYYPAASVKRLSELTNVTLIDLNPATLEAARNRLRRAGYAGEISTHEQSVFSPLSESTHSKFDSISLFYLLHCLPGSIFDKTNAILDNVIPALASGGVVYGATILGKGVHHTWIGCWLMDLYNKKGIFTNYNDDRDGLERCLKARFEELETKLIGAVLLFEARHPKY